MTVCRVSVVMTVRDGARTVVEAIESVLAQTFCELELVVVDDGSTDGTSELLEGLAAADRRVRTLVPLRRGRIPALNQAVAASSGEYVAVLDADDVAHPARIAMQLEVLDAHPEVALVGAAAELIDGRGARIDTISYPADPGEVAAQLLDWNCVAHSAATYRRSEFLRVGGYREEAQHAEDHDLWLRLTDSRAALNLEQTLLRYRIDPRGDTAQRLERQVTASLCAMEAARVRRASGADPVAAGERFDSALLRRLGIPRERLSTALASAAVIWSGYLAEAGAGAEAATLLRRAARAPATASRERARLARRLAVVEVGRARRPAAAVAMLDAIRYDPLGTGRALIRRPRARAR